MSTNSVFHCPTRPDGFPDLAIVRIPVIGDYLKSVGVESGRQLTFEQSRDLNQLIIRHFLREARLARASLEA